MNIIKKKFWNYRGIWHILKNLAALNREVCYAHLAFGQFGEDVILATLLGKDRTKGFYVDVGAYHPLEYSNTYRFYKLGWRGINIEPNPESFKRFPKYRPRDTNLNFAISDKENKVSFSCRSAMSGIVDENYIVEHTNDHEEAIFVETFPLRSILNKYLKDNQEIDFMSVDCEGHDEKVIRSNDWSMFRPKIALVEQHGPNIKSSLYYFMQENQYRFYCKVGLTLFFLREDFALNFIPD